MKITFLFLMLVTIVGCQAFEIREGATSIAEPWFNQSVFQDSTIGSSPYDLEFDQEFATPDDKVISFKNCLEVNENGAENIAVREYTFWIFLKANCAAVLRYYELPAKAVSYWDDEYGFETVKTFPALVIPHISSSSLDISPELLLGDQPGFNLVKEELHKVSIDYDDMDLDYVLISQGDFNRDGVQDLLVRLDWWIHGASGTGTDLIALTKLEKNSKPMILWRDIE